MDAVACPRRAYLDPDGAAQAIIGAFERFCAHEHRMTSDCRRWATAIQLTSAVTRVLCSPAGELTADDQSPQFCDKASCGARRHGHSANLLQLEASVRLTTREKHKRQVTCDDHLIEVARLLWHSRR
jgi:hypothetical protein